MSHTDAFRTGTIARRRGLRDVALFSHGFRPFFLFGALHAAAMLALWVPWYLGWITVPSTFQPVAWHTHELLFGYVPAVVAGFLLTAVPNWTGRLPLVGWPLASLFGLWLVGRLAVAASVAMNPALVAALSIAFVLALAIVIAREIVAGKSWRNLKVLGAVLVLGAAQALFHFEIWHDGRTTYADHLAIATTLTLIMIIGGRIVPSFTTNWLKKRNPGPLPTPFGRFDAVAMGVAVLALLGWVLAPTIPSAAPGIGILMLHAGLLQALRQSRWQPHRTFAEPLVMVLHVGFAFVPIGFLLAGMALLQGMDSAAIGATHAWTVGAIGMMTLAVMTRATRGHTGQALTAPAGTVTIYTLMLLAVVSRLAAAFLPTIMVPALTLAAVAWISAFGLFVVIYGRHLLRHNPTS